MGAAQAAATTIEQESIARGGRLLAETAGRMSPLARLLTSPAKRARQVAQELAEAPILMEKNVEGIASPLAVETLVKRYDALLVRARSARDEIYRAYRERAKAAGEPVLSYGDFRERVSMAMRRGDEDGIPEVAQAARETRALTLDPLKRYAQKLGLLPEDVKVRGATSYLHRIYDVAKIRAQGTEWRQRLEGYFRQTGMDAAEAADVTERITDAITIRPGGRVVFPVRDVVGEAAPLVEREINIPDSILEPFLHSDIDRVEAAYIKSLAPQLEVTARFGDLEMSQALGDIRTEYAILKHHAKRNDKELARLVERERADLEDVLAIRDRLYGTHGAPADPSKFFVRASRVARSVNFLRMLGGQTLSSFTDPGRMVLQYGLPKTFAGLARLVTNLDKLKIARAEMRRIGVGLDLTLNSRLSAIADVHEWSDYKLERGLQAAGDVFSIATLQSPWNTTMKTFSGLMSAADILEAATARATGGRVSRLMTARLANLGLDETMLRRIHGQWQQFGDSAGLALAHADRWTDRGAKRAFEAAVLKEVDSVILTPGKGDLPLLYSSEWGRMLLQFKSFAIASTNRIMIPLAQTAAQGDVVRAASGLGSLLALGALVYWSKQETAGQPLTQDPRQLAVEVIDRSGVLGVIMEPLSAGLQWAGATPSRYSDRAWMESLYGPTFGLSGELGNIAWRLRDGQLSRSDLHAIRRLIPGQNIFWLRKAVNALEGEAGDAMGLPEDAKNRH